ncbi:hypothetical protein Sinac_4046 [Singulisphaera acidiphila DSM 18658]|uniref:Uncharacterized protein n=2 Tax=Singulisphaera acidiphila TaxID=466153 RepID=L0DHV4_SINAD|nr:hypothetical protein Sinac_4046 [Singulisphaera acidiphila DSM 18658]
MRFKNRFAMILLVVLLVALVGTHYAQHHRSRKNVRNTRIMQFEGASIPVATKDLGGVAAANLLMANDAIPPIPWVNVDSGLGLDSTDKQLYQQMASLISGFTAVPTARTAYFSAFANNMSSWAGSIVNIQAQPQGGHLATVNVGAILSDSWVPYSNYSEQYLVGADNSVTYSASLDPDGTAGLDLGVILQ